MATRTSFAGTVYTMADNDRLAEPAAGLTIDVMDGRILSVGPQAEPMADCETRDLPPGAVIVPGLHDRHTHWMFALFANGVVLNGVTTLAEAAARIEAQLAKQATGWFVATGWNTGLLSPGLLTQAWLDSVVKGRKAIIFDQSFHSALLSTELAREIVPRFPREAVGSYQAGVIKHQYVSLAMAWMELDDWTLKAALLQRQITMGRVGFTRITDMSVVGFQLLHAVQDLYRRGLILIPCDFAVQPWMLREDPTLDAKSASVGNFQLRWMKEFADGAYGNQLACLCSHHRYSDGTSGMLFLDEHRYVDDVLLARERGINNFAIHCIGCGACEAASTAFGGVMQRLNGQSSGCIFSFEHFETVHPALIRHVAALQRANVRIQVCSQPGFLSDLTDYTDRLLPTTMARINPYGDFRKEGLLWVAGTDGAITGDDPWGGMALAVNRGGEQAITVPEILGTFIDAPLTASAPATFLVLDRDPFAHPEQIGQVRVLETWINGRRLFKRD